MRVLLIGNSRSPHIQKWCRSLREEDIDVHVATWAPGRIEGTPTWVLPHGRLAVPKTTVIAAIAALVRLFRQLRPAVVHCHSIREVDLGCYLTSAPVVASPWGYEIHEPSSRKWRRITTIKWVLSRADRVMVTAESMGDELVRRFRVPSAKIGVLSWGVDFDAFARAESAQILATRRQLGIPDDAVVFLNNRYFPVVDPNLLIEAFNRVSIDRPDVYLVLVQGMTDPQYWAQVKDDLAHGRVSRVRLVPGVLPHAEMRRYVQAADVFLNLPYRDQLSSSLLEAMAAGLLPIVSDLPAYRPLLQSGAQAIVVERPTAETVACAMLEAIEGLSSFRQDGMLVNRALIESDHNWPRQAKQMIAAYRDLIRDRGS